MTIAAFPAAAPFTVRPSLAPARTALRIVRAPSPLVPPAPRRPDPRPVTPPPAPVPPPVARRRPVVSGRVLVAAVAAGAVLPAVQAVAGHVDGSTVTTATLDGATLDGARLALAAQQGAATPRGAAASAMTALDGVTTVSMSGTSPDAGPTASAALTKAVGVARENGAPRFGTPYVAGDEKTLDGQVAKALGLLGLPQKLAPGVKKIIMRESTGNPRAINDWDSNATAGTPSKGLMQLIDPTFRNAVLPSLAGRGIYDPVANITAGVRTMVANHGMDPLMDGGRKNSRGHYIGYGGAKAPTDGLGLASRS